MIINKVKYIICGERLTERDPRNMLGLSRKLIDKDEWNSLDFLKTKYGAETLLSGIRRVKCFLDEKI